MPKCRNYLATSEKQQVKLFVVCQNITIIPTLHSLLSQGQVKIDGFLAPGHVSMVIGSEPYQNCVDTYHKPFVITGFEPLDILQAILLLVTQIVENAVKWKISISVSYTNMAMS